MNIKEVKIIDIPSTEDSRGILSSIEQNQDVPFNIKRVFYIHQIKGSRGGHALINTDQLLLPLCGHFKVKVYDRQHSKVFILNDITKGLYIPRLIFLEMFDFSENAVCMVLANSKYNKNKYLRSLEEFKSYINKVGT